MQLSQSAKPLTNKQDGYIETFRQEEVAFQKTKLEELQIAEQENNKNYNKSRKTKKMDDDKRTKKKRKEVISGESVINKSGGDIWQAVKPEDYFSVTQARRPPRARLNN